MQALNLAYLILVLTNLLFVHHVATSIGCVDNQMTNTGEGTPTSSEYCCPAQTFTSQATTITDVMVQTSSLSSLDVYSANYTLLGSASSFSCYGNSWCVGIFNPILEITNNTPYIIYPVGGVWITGSGSGGTGLCNFNGAVGSGYGGCASGGTAYAYKVNCYCASGTCCFTFNSNNYECCLNGNSPCYSMGTYPCTGGNTIASSSYTCHTATSPCDVSLYCTGTSPSCPAPEVMPNGTVCGSPSGVCDLNSTCDGSTTTCHTSQSCLSPSPVPIHTSSPPAPIPGNASNQGLSSWGIAGIAIGIIVLIVLVVGGIVFFTKKKPKGQIEEVKIEQNYGML